MNAPAGLSILDQWGDPIKSDAKVKAARKELVDHFTDAYEANRAKRQRAMTASFDAAGSGDEHKNIWANTDTYDADSAHSKAVRATLVQRSRYEVGNNGYSAGIASTYANDLIGLGPTLRMKTGSQGFNQMVEASWKRWCKETQWRRALWCMAHAKHQDGEAFGVIRPNRRLRHPVKFQVVLHETEQVTTPVLPWDEPGYIDGIRFDEWGNPIWYDLLERHPGSSHGVFSHETETIPAPWMLHWFKLVRPGQHRGVPENVSTLNLGASARRWREAVLAAAENIADFSIFIKTMFEPDELDTVSPMSTLDIQKRMMTALPAGYDAFQPRAEQPTASHAEFNKSLVSEQARPLSMPANKARCDSSDYNYASGRLDHQTYFGALDIERADCDDVVMDPLFDIWYDASIIANNWLGGNPQAISDRAREHSWDWPEHQAADLNSESTATDRDLKNGRQTLNSVYTDRGEDYEDSLISQAAANGVTVDEQRLINLLVNVPQHAIQYVAEALGIKIAESMQQSPPAAPAGSGDDDDD